MSLWPLFGPMSTPRHPMIIQTPPPPRSLRSRAIEIRDLVQVGELSRVVACADAAQLARPSASTIACLSKLHPPPQTQTPCPRVDILPPPLAPPTHPLSNSLIEQIMTHKLPFSSAADHAGWRYEHFMWTFQLDAGRARHPRAIDTLDVSAAFVPGRGALALMAFIRDAFQGGIPSAVRPWFFGGRLIALKKDGDSPSSRRLRPAIAIGSVIGRLISKCAAAAASFRFQRLFQPPTACSCASRPRHQTDGAPWPSHVY